VAVALLALPACTSGSDSAAPTTPTAIPTTTTTPELDDGNLLLGAVIPRGGSAPEIGVSMRAAVDLAVAQINEAGGVLGRKVRLIVRDEGDSPAAAMLAVQDLSQLGVDAIIGPASSLDVLGALDTAVGSGVLTCSPTASALALDDFPDNGLFVRTVPSDSLQAAALARVVEDSGSTDAVVVYLDDAYGRPFAEQTEASLSARGTEVTKSVGFTDTEKSIAAAVAAVTDVQPEVVVVIADASSGPAIIEAIDSASSGPAPTFVVNDAVRRPASSAKPFDRVLARRLVGVSPLAYPTSPEFLDALRVVDAGATGLYAQNAYDCVNLIALAAQASGSTTSAVMAAAIPDVSSGGSGCSTFATCNDVLSEGRNPNYDGPGGVITIDVNGNTSTAIFERFTFDDTGRDVSAGFISIGGA
jgi:branched-chain amino acid transport system substrate-binding protein